jgi:hypothetical protein
VAIAVDLTRYLHGRLSEPPRPAGVLPRSNVAIAPVTRPVVAALHPARSVYRAATSPPPLIAAPTVPVAATATATTTT